MNLRKINSSQVLNIVTIFVVLMLALVPVFVGYAQTGPGPDSIFGRDQQNIPGQFVRATSLSALINQILRILLSIVGLIALLFLVWGGFKYISAGGDEEAVGKAKQTIMNALIGLAIVILGYALVVIVYNVVAGRETNVT